MFQSTPPHGERRAFGLRALAQMSVVSIHAPARGATSQVRQAVTDVRFIPRPRTGSDPGARAGAVIRYLFQSTPPHGERLVVPLIILQSRASWVSIHAPARGATRCTGFRILQGHQGFNPRPRTGSDHGLSCSMRVIQSSVSIHAPARGATCSLSHAVAACLWGFNPRPRTGSDEIDFASGVRRASAVSIHAPARGATSALCLGCIART